ncbi:MAG: heme NO-binding domain-containing protein [Schleiferiaceae bacterium]|jgi:hypothetical protein|nr:heme NO-binding domain-containing protein [Schleiferiaceae bacterium]
MKGLIFSHLLTFVEKEYDKETQQKMLENAGRLSADGTYAEGESYPYEEIFQLAGNLSTITNVSMAKTFEHFGEYLFIQLARAFSQFFSPDETLFGFLQKLEDHIHIEVRKKYPDANLPGFEFEPIDENNLKMIYKSERAMSDFGIGMIKGAAIWFNRKVFVGKKDISKDLDGTRVELHVRLLW